MKNNKPKATEWKIARKRLFSKDELQYIEKNRTRLKQELLNRLREESMEEAGRIVKRARIDSGKTQEELANLLRTDRANISRMENGRQNVTTEILSKVALALGKELKIEIV